MKSKHYQWLIAIASLVSSSVFAACQQGENTHIWLSPHTVKAGAPVKILAVSSAQPVSELVLTLPNGEKQTLKATANTGVPWTLSATVPALNSGHYQIEAKDKNATLACRPLANGDTGAEPQPAWNATYEAFYAAWIEQLFDAPVTQNVSFPSLKPVLENAERNFLFNYLTGNEDKSLPATPDCADLPYFLRSYFAWKNGLPISFRACNRGTTQKPPSCETASIRTDFARPTPSAQFKALCLRLMDVVHSGNTRTSSYSEESDFYPLALRREVLWPGTIYADPYGHVLMIVKWVAQTPTSPGLLLAVDAQPDNSVTRKRFWEGTFLFANLPSAAPGFKAFRPIANSRSLLRNAELPGYSVEQENLTPDDFYAKMEKLININGLEAKQAYEAMLSALVEQLEARVQSVENGEQYFRHGGRTIEMPKGATIFETTGAWEDYATPSRDMRLLIAINVLQKFPDKIIRYPALFNTTPQAAPQLKAQIQQLHDKLIHEKKIRYVRSDGQQQELSVADILARKAGFEMSYNPNDCIELRWGATSGSEEYRSCQRHAPVAQFKQMLAIREWFREAKRPAR